MMKSNLKDKLTIQQRLILPIILLGVVALIVYIMLIPTLGILLTTIWLVRNGLVKYAI